ncbi:MAG: ABC transporter ATP-binding protein/permease [Lentimicrobiaceae bacterium]|nr:ABC transporter ATP-binding protein/permease [Lentimicrobiaceae bacterium]
MFFSILSLFLLEPFLQLIFVGNFDNLSSISTIFISILSKTIDIQSLMTSMLVIVVVVILLFISKNLFVVLSAWLMATIKSRFIQTLRNELYERITILPLSYFSQRKRGDVVSRAVNDVQELENTLLRALQQFLNDPITVIIYLVALFIIDYRLTIFTLLLLPFAGFFISLASRKLKKKSVVSKQKLGSLFSHLEESLSGLRIIKGFNAQQHAASVFDKENKKYTKLYKQILWNIDLASPLSEVLGVTVVMIILVFGGWQVLSGTGALSASLFIVYIALITQIINPAKNLATAFANYRRGVAVLERVGEILHADEKIVQMPSAVSIFDLNRQIEYKNVSFCYNDGVKVIDNISFTIKKGETCAIVGASGSGKSTLIDLLPRFYDVTSGEILIDGINIKNYVIDDLRGLFALVTQDVVLFNDTIYNNITYGMQNVPFEKVRAAAEAAYALEFIEALPHQFNTVLSDRGLSLSGGQRQRLSIARAILRNAPILILDEATSALDMEAGKKVHEAIEELMDGRTVIVITHRLSTIENMNQIINL